VNLISHKQYNDDKNWKQGVSGYHRNKMSGTITKQRAGFIDFAHRPEIRKHNVSKTGSLSVFRSVDGDTYFVGSLRKIKLQSQVQEMRINLSKDPTE
jgi:hypothetical protein